MKCGGNHDCHHHGCDCRGLLQGMLKPSLLLLIAREKAKHGYELGAELARLGLDLGVDSGRIYRILRQLEGEGLVKSEWSTATAGPARRNYLITHQGLDFLRLWQQTLEEAMARMGRVREGLEQLWSTDAQ